MKVAMTKHCSSCGAFSSAEARFCRACGAPFDATRANEGGSRKNGVNNRKDDRRDDAPVSPLAETMPLADEGRATENIARDDSHGGRAPETSRVSRAEMEDMLRRPPSAEAVKRKTEPRSAAPSAKPDRAPRPPVDASLPSSALAAVSLPTTQISAPIRKTAAQSSARRRPRWPVITASLVLAAFICGVLVWLYASRKDREGQPNTVNNAQTNAAAGDERQAIDAQMAEASALLASGDAGGAILRLREVVRLEPSNAPAHLKLAEALDRSAAHEEAVNEYLAATKLDEQNPLAWSALAHAQFSTAHYGDAVESYQRLFSGAGETKGSDEARLEYAAALQNTGRTNEARALYLKIAAAASEDAARRTAQQRLAGITLPSALSPPVSMDAGNSSTANSLPRSARANMARPSITHQETAANALPAPSSPNTQSSTRLPFIVPPLAPASADSSRNSKRAASNNPDSFYIKGLSVLNQRDPKTLQRAEVVTALGYFQLAAQPGGTHRAAAQQLAERLGRELDKRRSVNR